MKRLVVLLMPIVVVLVTHCYCWTSEPATLKDDIQFTTSANFAVAAPPDGPIVIVPVETVSKQSDMIVSFLFRNTSLQPLHYLSMGEGPRAEYPGFLYINFYRQGQNASLMNLAPIKFPKRPAVVAENVRTLKPGEYITCTLSLKDYAADGDPASLPTGIYELRGGYEVRPNTLEHDLGCTPLSINRTIMLIDVVE